MTTGDYGYIFCPKYEHLKSTAVCIGKCENYNRKLCIAVEKAYRTKGYDFTLTTIKTKGD